MPPQEDCAPCTLKMFFSSVCCRVYHHLAVWCTCTCVIPLRCFVKRLSGGHNLRAYDTMIRWGKYVVECGRGLNGADEMRQNNAEKENVFWCCRWWQRWCQKQNFPSAEQDEGLYIIRKCFSDLLFNLEYRLSHIYVPLLLNMFLSLRHALYNFVMMMIISFIIIIIITSF